MGTPGETYVVPCPKSCSEVVPCYPLLGGFSGGVEGMALVSEKRLSSTKFDSFFNMLKPYDSQSIHLKNIELSIEF